MNREEFMKQLERLLQNLPEEERQDALQYYEDYFEDAGPDRETEVIRELGSPEHVAESICEDLDMNQQKNPWESKEAKNTQGYQSGSYTNYENGQKGQNYQNSGQEYQNYGQGYQNGPQGYHKPGEDKWYNNSTNVVGLVILIVTLPITLPILGGILSAIAGIFLGVFGCVIAFFIGGVAMVIAAIVLFATGLVGVGFAVLGGGILLLCFAFLLTPLAIWLCTTAIPGLFRFVISGVKKLLEKGGNAL
ncbi:MAG: DUF1700 domain-containing protein [Lachnospiraceae bacterium]|nr:DUF1700 domain-containing protein [Lachnospiraceae bacterium]